MKRTHRYILLTALALVLCQLSSCPATAQTVNCQTAVSDSVFLNVVLTYILDKKPRLTLDKAYMTKRRRLKREAVECKRMNYKFEKNAEAVAFTFSFGFAYEKRSYRVQGRYAETVEGRPECVVRCVPSRLSDKTLRESEYQY